MIECILHNDSKIVETGMLVMGHLLIRSLVRLLRAARALTRLLALELVG